MNNDDHHHSHHSRLHVFQDKEAAWEAERKKSKPDLNVKFVYAYVLSRSSMERHKVTGIRLLNGRYVYIMMMTDDDA